MGKITTVKVQKKTRDRLAKFGSKLETFDGIINHLMDSYEKSQRNLKMDHDDRVKRRPER